MGKRIALLTSLCVSALIVTIIVATVVTSAMTPSTPETALAAAAGTPAETAAAAPAADAQADAHAPAAAPAAAPVAIAPTAGCEAFKSLIGAKADAKTRAAIKGRKFRILHPGDAATMDHVENRVNLHVDGQNVVVDVTCG